MTLCRRLPRIPALALGLFLFVSGCDDECSGPACEMLRTDAGPRDSGPLLDGGAPDAGVCRPYADPNACVANATCPPAAEVSLDIVLEATVQTDEMANPEIVGFIPGSDTRAVVVSAVSNQLVEITYDADSLTLTRNVRIATGSDTSELTSVYVSPDGSIGAVTVAEVDCGLGRLLLVDLADSDAFGQVLGSVEVGYNPDSSAFSPDGRYVVTADEDDREDRPCKPASRHGGSATVVDLAAGPDAPVVAQRLLIDHETDSEPEGVVVTPDGLVAIAIQETSELGLFDLADVPNATLTVIPLTPNGEPDGIAVSGDGRWLAIAQEFTDRILMIDLETRAIVTEHLLVGSGDIPDDFNRNDEDTGSKVYEPEGVVFMRRQGALFVATALQESHSVIAFRVDEVSGALSFDSISPVGIGWMSERDGRGRSGIGPEGLAGRSSNGLLLSANEREGSISLMSTAGTAPVVCP